MSGKNKIIQFRDMFYPGVKLTFVDAENPQDLYNILSGSTPPPDPVPNPQYTYYIDVPVKFSQRNSQWANDKLGQPSCSTKTIGAWGCLLVCYIMWERTKNISIRDPKSGNAHYTNSGCFSCHNILGGALRTANPTKITYKGWLWEYDTRFYSWLDQSLQKGFPVPIEVDFHPETGQWDQHWVLVNGKLTNGEYVAIDPWTGEEINVKQKYQNKIRQGVFYETATSQSNVRVGLHMSADGGDGVGFPQPIKQEISALKPTVLKYLSNHSPQLIQETCSPQLNPLVIVRAFLSWGGRNLTPQNFFDYTISDVTRSVNTLISMGVDRDRIIIEIHNEPNLHIEGFGYSWNSGASWGDFCVDILNRYKQALQGLKYTPGGLSPGGDVTNVRYDSIRFLTEFGDRINLFDYNALHLYTINNWTNDIWWYDTNVTKNKPIVITESSYLSEVTGTTYAAKLKELVDLLKTKQLCEGVTFFCASASNKDFYKELWLRNPNPNGSPYEVQSRGIAQELRRLLG